MTLNFTATAQCNSVTCLNNGTCLNLLTGGFNCSCPSGYAGTFCQNGEILHLMKINISFIYLVGEERYLLCLHKLFFPSTLVLIILTLKLIFVTTAFNS